MVSAIIITAPAPLGPGRSGVVVQTADPTAILLPSPPTGEAVMVSLSSIY
jgi:hypothetical protein